MENIMSTQNGPVAEAILAEGIKEALHEMSSDVLSKLSVEQQAALESKFMALDVDIRSAIASKYPGMTFAGMYLVRQAVKEANGKLASQKRPIWFAKLGMEASALKSGEKTIREYAEKQLRELAEELDGKESATLLKKYKASKDTTSKDAHIIQLCGIFGVNPATIA
jgi:hypothetical protein